MTYTHPNLFLNQKHYSISDIQLGLAKPVTAFEEATLSFIQSWLSDEQTFILQTSGSTGTPKKISATRAQLTDSAQATLAAIQISENSNALVALPTQYIAGIMMLVRSMIGNLRMHIVEPSSNPLALFSAQDSFDFAALVPYQVDEIYTQYGIAGINRIKNILIGGAPLANGLREKIVSAHSSIFLTYGMTETLSHIALQKISGNDRQDFFTTLPSITISVDERQCLLIETPYLAERIRTNDVVEILDPTSFRWLGRWDNVINSGGVKLMPEKIEQGVGRIFKEMDIKAMFFIDGLPDDRLGTRAVLVVESREPLDEVLFFALASQYLNKHEIPRQIYYTHAFEMTPTGKIKRKETLQKLSI